MSKRYLHADDGVRIPVHVEGEGPPLVVLPGWTGAWQDWGPAAEGLRERFTCYAWHPRPYHAGNATIERMAADLAQLIEQFELADITLMGHSMGAVNCWEYIRRRGTAKLARLVLIDMTPKMYVDADWSLGLWRSYTPEQNQRFVAACREDFGHAVIDLIAHSRVSDNGGPGIPHDMLESRKRRLQQLDAEHWLTAWNSFVGNDYRDVLPAIDVPTLLAYGAKSNYYGPAVAEYVAAHIPDAVLWLYPEAGHGPQVEAVEAFLRDLDAFVAEG